MAATVDPQKVLREAVFLMRQGQFAEALQKHLWFHEHALEHLPALGGVRLSFALDYWVELGTIYPKAMEALLAVRDRKTEALTDGQGSWELFHDVSAINRCLDEEQATIALFLMLHQHHPALARQCYSVAEKYLVDQQEFEVCSAYLPDPIARLEAAVALRKLKLEIADENSAFATPEFRDFVEMSFGDELSRLVAILVCTGQSQEAERVRQRALAVSSSDAVRAALEGGMDDL